MVAKKKPRLTGAQILKTLREHESSLRGFSVRKIGLFGSFAKGKPTAKSDIDFLVEFNEPTYENFYNLIEYLEKLFGRKVEILTPCAVNSIRVPEVADSIRESVVYA